MVAVKCFNSLVSI